LNKSKFRFIIDCCSPECSKKGEEQKKVIFFTAPLELIYTRISNKLGRPGFFDPELANNPSEIQVSTKIPHYIITENTKICEEELIYLEGGFIPLAKLRPEIERWRVKARVLKVHEKRFWGNERGSGYKMNIEIMDEWGTQMVGTFFTETIEKFREVLIENRVYSFTSGQCKFQTGKLFGIQGDTDYCIVFDKNSEIEEVVEDHTFGYYRHDSLLGKRNYTF